MYLAKTSPAMFVTSEVAKEALSSLLKRDMKVKKIWFDSLEVQGSKVRNLKIIARKARKF